MRIFYDFLIASVARFIRETKTALLPCLQDIHEAHEKMVGRRSSCRRWLVGPEYSKAKINSYNDLQLQQYGDATEKPK